jgi:hypothetical protein
VTTARHIRSIYRTVNDEMLVYAGPLEILVNGSTQVKEGDLVISFSPRPALQARLAGPEEWLRNLALNGDPSREVTVPTGSSLAPPSASAVPTEPQLGLWSEIPLRLNKVDAGDFSAAVRLIFHVIGRVTRSPLPDVSTAVGRQGQVPFSLPGWDLVLAVADDQPFGDQLSFTVDATPNAGQTISTEAIETLSLLLQQILGFITGSNVSVVPVVGLDANDEVVAARWAARQVNLDHTPLRWCYEGDVAAALPQLAAGRTQLEADDPVLAQCLDRAIALHLAANGQEVIDVRLPVACSGLELLAWSVLQQYGWLSPRATGSLKAPGRAQLLLKWAEIPTDLPPTMPALEQRRGILGDPTMQAVELAIYVRNKVVHPPNNIRSVEWPSGRELFEAWQFTSWCLELGILRLLEYRGNYASRLQLGGWSGQTAPVPWNLWPVTLDRSSHAQEHAPGLPLSDPLRPRRIARR